MSFEEIIRKEAQEKGNKAIAKKYGVSVRTIQRWKKSLPEKYKRVRPNPADLQKGTNKQLAKKYNVSTRTITRWRNEGIPDYFNTVGKIKITRKKAYKKIKTVKPIKMAIGWVKYREYILDKFGRWVDGGGALYASTHARPDNKYGREKIVREREQMMRNMETAQYGQHKRKAYYEILDYGIRTYTRGKK